MKKLIVSTLLPVLSILFVSAASNQKAMEYSLFGLNDPAKEILINNLKTATGQNLAETYYNLGEIYFAEQKKDSADYFYNKGLTADPKYIFNNIGKAKVLLSRDLAGAEKQLKEIADKNKKNMNIQAAVAEAYLGNKMTDKASKIITAAMNTNNSAAIIYLVQGDLLIQKNDIGNGCNAYEQAIYFDTNCKAAYVKYARVFSSRNINSSIAKLQELLAVDPASYLPYREMAQVYYKNGRFSNALKEYSKFISNDSYSLEDYPEYATLLFFNGDYAKSLEIVQTALKKSPNDFVLNRFLMWDNFMLKQYDAGLAAAAKFMQTKDGNFIFTDYDYYARLLSESGRKEEAIAEYEKGLNLDSGNIVAYKDMAKLYSDLGQYDNSIQTYETYIQKADTLATVDDYFTLGRTFYNAVTNDSLIDNSKKTAYCLEADSLFAYVAEKLPENYLGNLWRARINAVLDPETEKGLAKPYYEAVIPLLDKNNPRDARDLIECYRYLGYYFYLKDNIAISKSYWNKILEIDPTNETALQVLKEI